MGKYSVHVNAGHAYVTRGAKIHAKLFDMESPAARLDEHILLEELNGSGIFSMPA